MLKNLKTNLQAQMSDLIKDKAKEAVKLAETELTGEKGESKKDFAVTYVIAALPIPLILKPVAKYLVGELVEEAIEASLKLLKEKIK